MITPQQFLNRWDQEIYGLVTYDEDLIHLLSLSTFSKEFLIQAGLPESASPFLSFESSDHGGAVRLTEKDTSLDAHYSSYIYIGFDGTGNLICIDETTDHIIYIDHDQENQVVFINSSIVHMAESLLVYIDFIQKIKSEHGRTAFIDRQASTSALEWIRTQLINIDAAALEPNSFWQVELSNFRY